MSYEAIQGIPLEIDLNLQGRSTGWSVNGTIATHVSCNDGSIEAKDITLTEGTIYEVSFNVNSIAIHTTGYIRPEIGDTVSANITTTGLKTVNIEASGDNKFRIYAFNVDCEIELLAIRSTEVIDSNKQDNTLAFSQYTGKWVSFYNFSPDNGCSLFTNLYTFKNGQTYLHNPLSTSRANIYGIQYKPTVKIPFNEAPGVVKMFQSINMNSGALMVTDSNGIETAIGQVSSLSDIDFLQHTLSDGVSAVNVYDKDGIYLARFLRDSSTGNIYEGDLLRGNYIVIDLYTEDPDNLKIITIGVKSVPSIMNVR